MWVRERQAVILKPRQAETGGQALEAAAGRFAVGGDLQRRSEKGNRGSELGLMTSVRKRAAGLQGLLEARPCLVVRRLESLG